MPNVGEIWVDNDFYQDGTKKKYFVIAAVAKGFVTYRLTTSKPHGRSMMPACFTGDPYPAHFLDRPAPFWLPTWLSLQFVDDMDDYDFLQYERAGRFQLVGALGSPLLCQTLRCMVGASQRDLTQRQRRVVADAIASLGCP